MTGPLRPVKEVTITRSNWYRGNGPTFSRLLIVSGEVAGHMCCLGHVSRACGIEDYDLEDITAPSNILDSHRKGTLPDAMSGLLDEYGLDSAVCKEMMTINDDPGMKDEGRELRLTKLALGIGLSLTFVE